MSLTNSHTLSSDSSTSPGGDSHHSLGRTWGTIDNLLVHRGPIEEIFINAKEVTIIMMHAHVSLPQVLSSLSSNIENVHAIITCPCCSYSPQQSHFQNRTPDLQGDDYGCWSEKREVRIWLNDDGTREGFFNHQCIGEWDRKVFREEIGGAEKSYVKKVKEAGLSWSMAETAEEAYAVALEFYKNYPTHYGDTSNLPKLGAAADYPLLIQDVEASVNRMYQFTGTVTSRCRCLGKKLLFMTVILKGGIKLDVKVNDEVLTSELFEGVDPEFNVRCNSKLLDSALRGNLTVRVTGHPVKLKDGEALRGAKRRAGSTILRPQEE